MYVFFHTIISLISSLFINFLLFKQIEISDSLEEKILGIRSSYKMSLPFFLWSLSHESPYAAARNVCKIKYLKKK